MGLVIRCLYFNVCCDRGCSCALADHTTVDMKIYRELEAECIAELEEDLETCNECGELVPSEYISEGMCSYCFRCNVAGE